MSIKFARETIKSKKSVSRGSTRIIVENDLIVPDAKPDVGRILFADGDAFITSTEVDNGKVFIEGILRYNILYTEDSQQQYTDSLNANMDFSHTMDVPGVSIGMEARVKLEVEHIECRFINGRKINVKTILGIRSCITEENEYYFLNGVEEGNDVQVLKRSMTLNRFIGSSKAVCAIEDSIEIPSGSPSIKEILRNDIRITNVECKVADNKIIVMGQANIRTMYASDDKERSMRIVEREAPFTQIIDLPGIEEEYDVEIGYEIQNYSFEPIEDEDGELRLINGEIDVGIWVSVSAKEDMDVMVDTYGLRTELGIEKMIVKTEEYFPDNRSQVILKDTLTLDNDFPEVAEIINVFGKPILSEYELEENRVIIKGIVNSHVLYYSDDREQPVCCLRRDIPLSHTLEIEDIKPNMECEIDLDMEHINYSMISDRDVEVRLVVGVNAKLHNEVEHILVENVIENPLGEERTLQPMPSITIYFVQEGDTLWDIAKKYRSTCDDIAKENKIENTTSIPSGMQVFISRK
jgi:hypothetical protein